MFQYWGKPPGRRLHFFNGCPFFCALLEFILWKPPLWSESRRWPEGKIEGVRGKITHQSTSGSDPCNPSYIDIPKLCNSCSLSVGMFISFPIHFWAPSPQQLHVFAPESPTPVESPAFSCFHCFLFCFYISISTPTPPVSSPSRHKLVFFSLPLILSFIPTVPFSFPLGAIPCGRFFAPYAICLQLNCSLHLFNIYLAFICCFLSVFQIYPNVCFFSVLLSVSLGQPVVDKGQTQINTLNQHLKCLSCAKRCMYGNCAYSQTFLNKIRKEDWRRLACKWKKTQQNIEMYP